MLGRTFASRCDVRRSLDEKLHAGAGGRALRPFLARAAALALLAALLIAPPLAAQRDARVAHRNVAELVSDSYVILSGRVARVYAEAHPQFSNINTVVIEVQVSEVLKGQAGSTYKFRAFVQHPLDFKAKLGYSDGQEYLLMLTQPHAQTGLSSPAGLEQGRFRIARDANGNRIVANGYNNAGLFRNVGKAAPKLDSQLVGMPARQLLTQHYSGPIPYDDLRNIIQALVQNSAN